MTTNESKTPPSKVALRIQRLELELDRYKRALEIAIQGLDGVVEYDDWEGKQISAHTLTRIQKVLEK